MVEAYERDGKRYDYLNRILASFAEIYNYDYSMSSLMEDGSLFGESGEVIRKNGILPRIRAYFEQHYNESEVPMKMFYNEVMFDTEQKNEYGFLTFGELDDSVMAAMISLSVRILEACGLRDIVVRLQVDDQKKESLFRHLDSLDINYEEVELASDFPVSFEILMKNELGKEMCLACGGDYSNVSKKISGLDTKVFAFQGFLEPLIVMTYDLLHLDEKMLDVVVTYDSDEEKEHGLYLTQELRLNGFKTEMIKRCEKKFIKEHYNTRYVISVKGEDMKRDEVLLVDLYTNEKMTLKELDLVGHLDINF